MGADIVFPPRIETLQVEHLTEIPWNETALNKVVLEDIKKELIKALVTTHLEKSQSADVVENKGNGMILLLHGPPGKKPAGEFESSFVFN